MRTAITPLRLRHPRSLRDALRLMRAEAPMVPLAGCTDVYVGLNFGTLEETRFLDLWHLDELRGIERRGGVLRIGALTSYTDIIESPLVGRYLPMLVSAAREVGAVQIQNRGTIGGNIATGSPAGDTLPVMAAADAIVELRSLDGTRKVRFSSFYTGYRRTVMRADELITAIEIPRVEGVQFFRKVGTRAAQSISKVVIAGIRAAHPRISFGSVAPTVIRVPRTEAALASGASMSDAQRILQTEIAPIDDLRSTEAYRRRVAANLLADFWATTA